MRFALTTFWVSILLNPVAVADNTLTTAYDYFTSSDFECRTDSRQVLKPGLVSPEFLGKDTEPVCLIVFSCTPRSGKYSSTPFTSAIHCRAPKGVCVDSLICAKEDANPSALETSQPSWTVFDLSNESIAPKKAGCVSKSSLKDQAAVYQFYDGKIVAEQVCFHSYLCENEPTEQIAMCGPSSQKVLDASGRATSKLVCPQLADCIEKKVPLMPGYTESQLTSMAPAKSQKIRELLQAPAKVAVVPPSNTVSAASASSQNYQSRTASIAGSRASTGAASTPPASKPPTTGHTGRGMK